MEPKMPTTLVHRDNVKVTNNFRKVEVGALPAGAALRTNVLQNQTAPLTPKARFYQMTVDEIDSMQYVMFGVTYSFWPSIRQWDIEHSIRYHSNDGGLFNGNSFRTHVTYSKGDTVTCFVRYFGRAYSLVDYFKNDRYIYRQFVFVPGTDIYPTMGFSNTTASLTVKWPSPMLGSGDRIQPDSSEAINWLGFKTWKRSATDGEVSVSEPMTHESKALSLAGPAPLDREFCYFELILKELAPEADSAAGIGITPALFSETQFPGWTKNSVGYHSDDGGIHCYGEQVACEDANVCKQGDVMGCGVIHHDVIGGEKVMRESDLVTVYFTKNGSLIYEKVVVKSYMGWYPCVAIMNHKNTFKINTKAKIPASVPIANMKRALEELNVAQDLVHSEELEVSHLEGWKCAFKATSAPGSYVQMTSWAVHRGLQCFTVTPTAIPESLGKNYKVEVGLAEKQESPTDSIKWVCKCTCSPESPQVISESGIKIIPKYNKQDGPIKCMVDFTHDPDGKLMVVFSSEKKTLGRSLAERRKDQPSLYATVAVSGTGVTVAVDWSGVLFPPSFTDPKQEPLSNWLRGEEELVTVRNPYSLNGRGTSLQSNSYFRMGWTYVAFRVHDINGQLPSVGLSTAWSDMTGVIGGHSNEMSFDFMTGEVLYNNEIIKATNPLFDPKQDVLLGIGVVFPKQNVRAVQDIVVYITKNSVAVYNQVFTSCVGGVYPTITLPRNDCRVDVIYSGYPQIPTATIESWKANVTANKEYQEKQQEGFFSKFSKETFSHLQRSSSVQLKPAEQPPPPSQPVVGVKAKEENVKPRYTFQSDGKTVIETGPDKKATTRTVGSFQKGDVGKLAGTENTSGKDKEKDAASVKEKGKDATSGMEKQKHPASGKEKEKEATSIREKEKDAGSVKEKEKDASSVKEKDASSVKEKDASSVKGKDASSVKGKDASSVKGKDASSEKGQDNKGDDLPGKLPTRDSAVINTHSSTEKDEEKGEAKLNSLPVEGLEKPAETKQPENESKPSTKVASKLSAPDKKNTGSSEMSFKFHQRMHVDNNKMKAKHKVQKDDSQGEKSTHATGTEKSLSADAARDTEGNGGDHASETVVLSEKSPDNQAKPSSPENGLELSKKPVVHSSPLQVQDNDQDTEPQGESPTLSTAVDDERRNVDRIRLMSGDEARRVLLAINNEEPERLAALLDHVIGQPGATPAALSPSSTPALRQMRRKNNSKACSIS